MIRILLIVIVGVLIIVAVAFRGVLLSRFTPAPQTANQPQEVPLGTPTTTGQLTNTVNDLIAKTSQPLATDSPTADNAAAISALQLKVKTMETSIQDLRAQVVALKGSGSSATTSTSSQPPLYIPLNFNGQINSTEWQTLPNQTLAINPSNYPGYSSMVLIVQLQVFQGSGIAYARLVNTANGVGIPASQVSTSTYYFSQVTSSSFTLPAGSQPYGLQLKNLTPNYPAIVQSATLLVNY